MIWRRASTHAGTQKKDLQGTPESRVIDVVRERGLEPPHLAAPDPKSGASAIPPFPHMKFNIQCLDLLNYSVLLKIHNY